MKEQPAWLSALLKSAAVSAAGITAVALGKVGVTLDTEAVAGLVLVYVAIESAGAAWVASKVAPLSKMARLMPDEHASYMAMTRKP